MKIFFKLFFVTIIPLLNGLVFAQSEGLILEEVFVTAQKRTESLQDVPIAIQAVSGEALRANGIGSLSSLEQISSSITLNDFNGNALATVRGVGSSTPGNGNYSSVAIYVDDVYLARPTSGLFGFDNIEQVQVLRGPQGALYGRNATGGAIVVTTKTPNPSDEFSGRVSGGYGDFDQRTFGLSLSGGFAENWAASFNLSSFERDGYLKSTTPGTEDLDSRDTFTASTKLVFSPLETATFELGLWYDESDDTNGHGFQQINAAFVDAANPLNAAIFSPNALPQLTNPQLLVFGAVAGGACAVANLAPCSPGDLFGFLTDPANAATVAGLNAGAGATQFDTEFGSISNNEISAFTSGLLSGNNVGRLGSFSFTEDFRASFKATIAFDGFDLISITSFTDSLYEAATDIVGIAPGTSPAAPNDNVGFSAIFDTESQAQEIRLVSKDAAIEWLVGLYYFHEDGTSELHGDFFGASPRVTENAFDVDSYAAFGQIKFPLGDVVNLTIGGRFTDEEFELDDSRLQAAIDAGITAPGVVTIETANTLGIPGAPFATEDDFSQLTGGVILDATFAETLVYTSISTGFKSGNLNTNNPLTNGVDEEEILAYEVGFKSEYADGRVRFNGAGFLYDYDNIHVQVVDSGSGASILLNGSKAEILGVEFELVALLTNGLTLNAGLTLLDSEYKDDINVPPPGLGTLQISGNNVVGAPEDAFTLGFEYVVPVRGDAEIVWNGNAAFNGGYFHDIENRTGTGGNSDEEYTVFNTNVTYRTQVCDVSLWVNNLTDEEYYRTGLVANGLSELGISAPPRTYGLSLGYNF